MQRERGFQEVGAVRVDRAQGEDPDMKTGLLSIQAPDFVSPKKSGASSLKALLTRLTGVVMLLRAASSHLV